MFEFFQKLFIGHSCRYEIYEEIDISYKSTSIITGKFVVLQCKICGKMKNHKITA